MDIVTARDTKVVAMGRKSSGILIAFVVIMLMAIAAYIKIWTIDYRISSQESLLLRSLYCNRLVYPCCSPFVISRFPFSFFLSPSQRCMVW